MGDWRLVNQEKYLKNKTIVKAVFYESNDCDHTHCAFCWEKFSRHAGSINHGYRVINGPWWICEKCYNDFKDRFGWKLV